MEMLELLRQKKVEINKGTHPLVAKDESFRATYCSGLFLLGKLEEELTQETDQKLRQLVESMDVDYNTVKDMENKQVVIDKLVDMFDSAEDKNTFITDLKMLAEKNSKAATAKQEMIKLYTDLLYFNENHYSKKDNKSNFDLLEDAFEDFANGFIEVIDIASDTLEDLFDYHHSRSCKDTDYCDENGKDNESKIINDNDSNIERDDGNESNTEKNVNET